MDRQFKHDLGYWMSVFGFAVVLFGGLLYPFATLDPVWSVYLAAGGFVVFLVGAELALRNQRHLHHDEEK